VPPELEGLVGAEKKIAVSNSADAQEATTEVAPKATPAPAPKVAEKKAAAPFMPPELAGAVVQAAVQKKPTLNIGGSLIPLDDMDGEEDNLYARDDQYIQGQNIEEDGPVDLT